MKEELKIFDSPEFGEIRTSEEDGRVLFCGSDVAKALGYARPNEAVAKHSKGTLKRRTPTSSGNQEMLFITEGDVYRLIASSKLPTAQRFESWVFDEVLPSIRQDGGYMAARDETPEQTMARALLIADKTIKRQTAQIDEMRPKALFADAVAASDGTCLVGEMAKMLRQNGVDVGQNRFYEWLRRDGLLGKSGHNRNVPTQRAMELGLFRINETAITHSDGHVTINRTPKVTGIGQRYFLGHYSEATA